MCPQELRSDRQCTQRGRRGQRRRKMQSAKNRLETVVPPAPSRPLPRTPDTDSSTRQDHRTHCRVQLKTTGSSLASCPQNKSKWRAQDLRSWDDLDEHSSLHASLPSSGPTKGQQGDGATEQADDTGGGGEVWQRGGAGRAPETCSAPQSTDSQRNKQGLGFIRTSTNPALLTLILDKSMGLRLPHRLCL